jgi:hypothetical protein
LISDTGSPSSGELPGPTPEFGLASASPSSSQWKDEDYDVLADGKVVGRILEEGSRFGPPKLR